MYQRRWEAAGGACALWTLEQDARDPARLSRAVEKSMLHDAEGMRSPTPPLKSRGGGTARRVAPGSDEDVRLSCFDSRVQVCISLCERSRCQTLRGTFCLLVRLWACDTVSVYTTVQSCTL